MKHWIYEHILSIAFGLIILIFAFWAWIPKLQTTEFLYPALGAAVGLSYFALKQHLEEVELFKELFTKFNERFNDMNGVFSTQIDSGWACCTCGGPQPQPQP
jgi:hypothetical protein